MNIDLAFFVARTERALGALLLLMVWFSAGCGRVAGVGTSTDWVYCETNAECGNGTTCECGLCTRECNAVRDCSGLGRNSQVLLCAPAPDECSTRASVCTPDQGFSWFNNGESPGNVSTMVDGGSAPASGGSSSEGGAGGNSAGGTASEAGSSGSGPTSGPNAMISVDTGADRSCSVRAEDGAVRCWGQNLAGSTRLPEGEGGFTSVAVGNDFACGLRDGGAGLCWGADNDGELEIPEGVAFSSLSLGGRGGCGLTLSDNQAVCWGQDLTGLAPAGVSFTALSVGTYHACGVREADSLLQCWGADANGSTDYPGDVEFLAVGVGYAHACAIRAYDEQLQCWGQDTDDLLTPPAGRFSSVDVGFYFACAIQAEDGIVVCWGDNTLGQTDAPLDVAFSSISTGGDHACGIRQSDSGVECWGSNEYDAITPPTN